jgi:hypothetical protein
MDSSSSAISTRGIGHPSPGQRNYNVSSEASTG